MKRKLMKRGRFANESYESVRDTIMKTSQEDLKHSIDCVNKALKTLDVILGSEDISEVPRIEKKLHDVRDALMDSLPYNHSFNESDSPTKGLEELQKDLKAQFGKYEEDDSVYIDEKVGKDDDGKDVLTVCQEPGTNCISQIMKYINQTYGKRFDMVLSKYRGVLNLDIYDLEADADKEGPKDLPGQMVLPGFDESADGGSVGWSEYGELLNPLPMDCILGCSHGGRCDDDVEFWVNELNFADGLPVEKAKRYLQEYGAWDEEELENMSDDDVAQRVLWIFCGNIKDEAYEFMRDGDNQDWPDLEDWDEKDWRRFQEEQCYLGLNN